MKNYTLESIIGSFRSPDLEVEKAIIQAFFEWKRDEMGKSFQDMIKTLRTKCSLKTVFIYFEALKYMEENVLENTHEDCKRGEFYGALEQKV